MVLFKLLIQIRARTDEYILFRPVLWPRVPRAGELFCPPGDTDPILVEEVRDDEGVIHILATERITKQACEELLKGDEGWIEMEQLDLRKLVWVEPDPKDLPAIEL